MNETELLCLMASNIAAGLAQQAAAELETILETIDRADAEVIAKEALLIADEIRNQAVEYHSKFHDMP